MLDSSAFPDSWSSVRPLGPAHAAGGLSYRLDLTTTAASVAVDPGHYAVYVENPPADASVLLKLTTTSDTDALADAASGASTAFPVFPADAREVLYLTSATTHIRARLTTGTGILRIVRVI